VSIGTEIEAWNPGLLSQPRWYAVYTSPRHEKRVSQQFTERRIENFLPLYRTVRQYVHSRVPLELPLFPTYLFVHIAKLDRGTVLGVPGVLSIVGSGRENCSLPDAEIEALRSGFHLCKFEPHHYLIVGQRVRIVAGPLAGLEGVLVRKKKSLRVVLSVQEIMQSFAVEVDAGDLEPVGSSAPFFRAAIFIP
jgi:transcription antitermination factor NusG